MPNPSKASKTSSRLHIDLHDLADEMHEVGDIHIPYGRILGSTPVQLDDGTEFTWWYVKTFAILWYLCSMFPKFLSFLKNHTRRPDGTLHASMVWYTDETSPGNEKRHDKEMVLQTFHWTISQWPSWFRAHRYGWLTFSFPGLSVQDKVPGGLSELVKIAFRIFFGTGTFNFAEQGMLLPPDEHGHRELMKMTMHATEQDEKAFKSMNGVKGAGGWKCCLSCRSVMNCDPNDVAEDPYLVHYSEATPDLFDMHTSASFYEMVDVLDHLVGTATNATLGKLQKVYGINHIPSGLLLDKHLRKYYCAVAHTYHDPQHVLLTSGGVAQYEENAFTLEIVDTRLPDGTIITLEFLDDFRGKWFTGLQKASFQRHFSRIAWYKVSLSI